MHETTPLAVRLNCVNSAPLHYINKSVTTKWDLTISTAVSYQLGHDLSVVACLRGMCLPCLLLHALLRMLPLLLLLTSCLLSLLLLRSSLHRPLLLLQNLRC